jgi:hypothetical protein
VLAHGLEKNFRPHKKSARAPACIAPRVDRPMARLPGLSVGVAAALLLFASTACYIFNKIKQEAGGRPQNPSDRPNARNDDNAGQFGGRGLTLISSKVNFL